MFNDLALVTEYGDRDIGVRAGACFGARLGRHGVVRLYHAKQALPLWGLSSRFAHFCSGHWLVPLRSEEDR